MFSVEVNIRIRCPNCGYQIKRRFLDYLGARTTSCPGCNGKIVHLARGQTAGQANVEMDEIRNLIEGLEGNWTNVLNEHLTHESRQWGSEEPELA